MSNDYAFESTSYEISRSKPCEAKRSLEKEKNGINTPKLQIYNPKPSDTKIVPKVKLQTPNQSRKQCSQKRRQVQCKCKNRHDCLLVQCRLLPTPREQSVPASEHTYKLTNPNQLLEKKSAACSRSVLLAHSHVPEKPRTGDFKQGWEFSGRDEGGVGFGYGGMHIQTSNNKDRRFRKQIGRAHV